MTIKSEQILIFCGFLDAVSVSILITSLPLHLKSFNVSITYIGLFNSLYGALQILSSYFMGHLADKMRKKTVICICAFFTAIGYFALGCAPSFMMIFFLRIISGLFKQTQTISRTILVTGYVNANIKGVGLLGKLSAFISAGFIFGPTIGGFLYEKYGFFSIGCVSSFGFILMFLLYLKLDSDPPKSHQSQPQVQAQAAAGDVNGDSMWTIMKNTWDIQLSIFILSFCPLLFRTNYSLALRELFQSTSVLSGFATSSGAVMGTVAGFATPFVVQLYQRMSRDNRSNIESKLLLHTSSVLAGSFFMCSIASTLTWFSLFQLPVSFVNSLSREAFSMVIMKRVPRHKIGRINGINGSLVAFGRLIAPTFGSLLQEISFRLPIFFSCLLSFCACGIIHNYFDSNLIS